MRTMLALGLLAAAAPVNAQDDDLAWAQDIVLRADFLLKESESGTNRWVTAPKVTVVEGTKEQQKAVAAIVDHLNETLKGTPLKKIELLKPNDRSATLPIYFVHRADLPKKAGELGATADQVKQLGKDKSTYWSYIRWGAKKFEIQSGHVLVSSDAADAKSLRHNLLAALCYNLGFVNYSSRRPDSLFYRDGGKQNNAEQLTPKDRQLIAWYYSHVPAGSNSIKKAFEDHWAKDK